MGGEHHHAGAFDRMGPTLEIEGELSSGLVEEAIALAARLLDDTGVQARRVIDLGCGPGVGTAALAESFPAATVVAVDGSQAMLERAAARAARLGHADRVQTRQLDLNGDLATLERCDLVLAAMAVHHVDDEVATLRRIRSLIEPRGLLCVLERAEPMSVRFADELGRPGIWERFEEAWRRWSETMRARLPGALNAGAYPSMLTAAGLDLVAERTIAATVEAPDDPATQRFITGQLRQTLTELAGQATAGDLEALRAHLDGRPSGAAIRSSRKLFIARPRPS